MRRRSPGGARVTILLCGLAIIGALSFAVERRIRADESAPYNTLARPGRKRLL